MPEGHTIHRLAKDHTPLLVGHPVALASPQGRFATGAEMLTGRVVRRIDPYGKHLFYDFEGGLLLHVHLGLYGKWQGGVGPPPEPRGALRLRAHARRRAAAPDHHHRAGRPRPALRHPLARRRALRLPPPRAALPAVRHRGAHAAHAAAQPVLVPDLPVAVTAGSRPPR